MGRYRGCARRQRHSRSGGSRPGGITHRRSISGQAHRRSGCKPTAPTRTTSKPSPGPSRATRPCRHPRTFAGGNGMPVPPTRRPADTARGHRERPHLDVSYHLDIPTHDAHATVRAIITCPRPRLANPPSLCRIRRRKAESSHSPAPGQRVRQRRHSNQLPCPVAIENDKMRTWVSEDPGSPGDAFPLGRLGQPKTSPALALSRLLASSWITGVTLDVAGGKIMCEPYGQEQSARPGRSAWTILDNADARAQTAVAWAKRASGTSEPRRLVLVQLRLSLATRGHLLSGQTGEAASAVGMHVPSRKACASETPECW